MRKFLLSRVQKHLQGSADMAHFTPAYKPWDQRLCVVSDADLFGAIRSGKAPALQKLLIDVQSRRIDVRTGRRTAAR